MFKDETEQIQTDVQNVLELFDLDEILDHNDLTVEDLLVLAVREGLLELPDIRPV